MAGAERQFQGDELRQMNGVQVLYSMEWHAVDNETLESRFRRALQNVHEGTVPSKKAELRRGKEFLNRSVESYRARLFLFLKCEMEACAKLFDVRNAREEL